MTYFGCNSCGDLPDCLILRDHEYLCFYCYNNTREEEL